MNPQSSLRGRFAPSPSGRMHLGNIFTALISYLSVKSSGGSWILRIEDLDPQRSRLENARLIEDDLLWLGLQWDEGGLDDIGPSAPYRQSLCGSIYSDALDAVSRTGLLYPCFCTRADLMASNAPHQSDGRIIYPGTCRPAHPRPWVTPDRPAAARLRVPDCIISFTDGVFGPTASNLATDCGDFILRRADGAWAYQLAVVVDDARMAVNQVVRGSDLLLSTAQQLYLYQLLRLPAPQFAHVPLICNSAGRRLSKRDQSLSMQTLRRDYSPEHILGILGYLAGLIPAPEPVPLHCLLSLFSWDRIPRCQSIILTDSLLS